MNKGILYIILSGLCFIIVNFFVKILGAGPNQMVFDNIQHYPGHELVLARSVISFSLSLFVIKRKGIPVFGNNKKWLIIRGLSGTIALTIFFYTIHTLPLAIASIVQYLAPIFTVIFAMILLKEKVREIQWIFILLSFSGVALIGVDKLLSTSDGTSDISFFWLGLGVLSAVLSGVAYTAIMKLKTTDQPITIVMYFPMVAIPIMVIFCLFEFTMPTGIEWLFLLVIGIFTQFAQILMTKALHEGSAATITPFQYLGAIYAFLIGFFIFDEQLSWVVYVGMCMAIVGVVVNAIIRNR